MHSAKNYKKAVVASPGIRRLLPYPSLLERHCRVFVFVHCVDVMDDARMNGRLSGTRQVCVEIVSRVFSSLPINKGCGVLSACYQD